MADLTSSTIAANYNKFSISQSDAGRELVVSASKSNMTDADLLAVIRQLTLSGGTPSYNTPDTNGPDATTIAAFGTADGTDFESGVTDVVYFRVQTTGTPNTSTVSGVTLAVVAQFQPRF